MLISIYLYLYNYINLVNYLIKKLFYNDFALLACIFKKKVKMNLKSERNINQISNEISKKKSKISELVNKVGILQHAIDELKKDINKEWKERNELYTSIKRDLIIYK